MNVQQLLPQSISSTTRLSSSPPLLGINRIRSGRRRRRRWRRISPGEPADLWRQRWSPDRPSTLLADQQTPTPSSLRAGPSPSSPPRTLVPSSRLRCAPPADDLLRSFPFPFSSLYAFPYRCRPARSKSRADSNSSSSTSSNTSTPSPTRDLPPPPPTRPTAPPTLLTTTPSRRSLTSLPILALSVLRHSSTPPTTLTSLLRITSRTNPPARLTPPRTVPFPCTGSSNSPSPPSPANPTLLITMLEQRTSLLAARARRPSPSRIPTDPPRSSRTALTASGQRTGRTAVEGISCGRRARGLRSSTASTR